MILATLFLSIYNKIFNISDPDEYSDLFIKHFFKWSSFFLNKRNEGLTKDEVKGLIGELIYLKNLLLDTTLNVDDVLLSWRGPYDDGHDFVFDFIGFFQSCSTRTCVLFNVSITYFNLAVNNRGEQTLDEEKGADKLLTEVAVNAVNLEAAEAEMEE